MRLNQPKQVKPQGLEFGISIQLQSASSQVGLGWVRSCPSNTTGCGSHFENLTNFKILKEPLLVLKQTIHQKKALNLSFNMAPWKWAWHYQEGVTMTCRKRTFFTPRPPMLFAAKGRGALLISPRPLSGCQIKAKIKGCLLMYRLFLY